MRHDGDRTIVIVGARPRRDRAVHPRPFGQGLRNRAGDLAPVAELAEWSITVESWDAGELR